MKTGLTLGVSKLPNISENEPNVDVDDVDGIVSSGSLTS